MRKSYSEGLANHTDPESCGYVGNDISEALTGAHAGWVLSRESFTLQVWSADAVRSAGRQHRMPRYGKRHLDSTRSETPRTYGNSLYRNWEIPCSALAYDGSKARTVNPKGARQ
jgi:hypothetical protein